MKLPQLTLSAKVHSNWLSAREALDPLQYSSSEEAQVFAFVRFQSDLEALSLLDQLSGYQMQFRCVKKGRKDGSWMSSEDDLKQAFISLTRCMVYLTILK